MASSRTGHLLAAMLLAGCSTLTEDGERTPTCVTGTRWVGGDTGHEEMHPGKNCVGCHRENDGPPLALGGTIYALDGQEDDCFGEPGVTVLVKDAEGKLFEFMTNAAGNFYLEGDESQVAKPYEVKIRWPDPAASAVASSPTADWEAVPPGVKERSMFPWKAMTGDCGFCHKAELTGAANVMIGGAYVLFEKPRADQGRPLAEFPLDGASARTATGAPAPAATR